MYYLLRPYQNSSFIKLISLLIISFSFVQTALAKEHETIVIDNVRQLKLIGKQTLYLEDPTGELTLEQILSSEDQYKFQQQEKDVFNRPGTKSAFWFKFSMRNCCEEDAWLEVGSTYAWYIDFYAPDSKGKYSEIVHTGTMRPKENKLQDVNLFWLPLNMANETEIKTYYLRIESGLTFELPLQIGTIRSLSKNKDINDFLTAGFIGLLLVMFLYNLF